MNKIINIAILAGLIAVVGLASLIIADPFDWRGSENPISLANPQGLLDDNVYSSKKELTAYDKLMLEALKKIDSHDYYQALNYLTEADLYIKQNKPKDTDIIEKIEKLYEKALIELAKSDEEKGINRDYSELLLETRRSIRDGRIFDDVDKAINSALFRSNALSQHAEALDLLFIADQMYPDPKQQILINNLYTSITSKLRDKDTELGIKREYVTLEQKRNKRNNKLYDDHFNNKDQNMKNDTEIAFSNDTESEIDKNIINDTTVEEDKHNTDDNINEIELASVDKTTRKVNTLKEVKEVHKTSNKNKTVTHKETDSSVVKIQKNDSRDDSKKVNEEKSKNKFDKDNKINITGDFVPVKEINDKNTKMISNINITDEDTPISEYEEAYRTALEDMRNLNYDEALNSLLNLLKYRAVMDRGILFNVYNSIGLIYELKGQDIKSLGFYNESVKWDKKNVIPLVRMGKVYYKLGMNSNRTNQFGKSKEFLHRALLINPNSYEALIALGKTETVLGNYSDAVRYFRKASYIKPGSIEAKKYLAESLANIGKSNESVSQFEMIIDTIESGIAEDYTSDSVKYILNNDLGGVSVTNNDLNDVGVFYIKYASALNNSGRLDDSKKAYQKALEYGADDTLVYSGLASVYFNEYDYSSYIDCMEKVILFDGEKPEYLLNIATAYNIMGELDEAISYYRRSISLDPDNPFPKEELAKVYYSSGDYERGSIILEQNIDSGRLTPDTYHLLGEGYIALGKNDEAMVMFNRLIEKYPDYANIDVVQDYLSNLTADATE